MRTNIILDPTRLGDEAERLRRSLLGMIVGQDEAVTEVTLAYQMYLTGMNAPNRPIYNVLFLGPTGSGKTRTVEALAEALVNNPRAVIKVDCGEFQHGHEIAKLIGSPPGYLGHRETHPLLSQEVLNSCHTERMKISFVLFDEIEKASDILWNLLLGILDKAVLTLGDNRKVDFSSAMIFLTGNIGAAEIASFLTPKLGFNACESVRQQHSQLETNVDSRLDEMAKERARRKFTPEFVNRLDKIVVFKPLGLAQLRQILDIELGIVQQRIWNQAVERSFVIQVEEAAKDLLLREGTDIRYGARFLKRAIDRLLVQPLSNLIATQQVSGGDIVEVGHNPESHGLTFNKIGEQVVLPDASGAVSDSSESLPDASESDWTYSAVASGFRSRR